MEKIFQKRCRAEVIEINFLLSIPTPFKKNFKHIAVEFDAISRCIYLIDIFDHVMVVKTQRAIHVVNSNQRIKQEEIKKRRIALVKRY